MCQSSIFQYFTDFDVFLTLIKNFMFHLHFLHFVIFLSPVLKLEYKRMTLNDLKKQLNKDILCLLQEILTECSYFQTVN